MYFCEPQLFFDFSIGHNHRLQEKALATLGSPSNVRVSLCKQTAVYLGGDLTVATFEVRFCGYARLSGGHRALNAIIADADPRLCNQQANTARASQKLWRPSRMLPGCTNISKK